MGQKEPFDDEEFEDREHEDEDEDEDADDEGDEVLEIPKEHSEFLDRGLALIAQFPGDEHNAMLRMQEITEMYERWGYQLTDVVLHPEPPCPDNTLDETYSLWALIILG